MSDYLRKKLAALDRKTGKSSSYRNKSTSTANRSKKDDDEDDIAPIRSTRQEDDGGFDFFQRSSLFDDGWQFGDVTKTVLGSAGDAGLNIVKGAGGLVEGVTDLLGYGAAGIADAFGQDDYADRVRQSARENTLDRILAPAEDYLDDYSVFGKTSDAILQGVGQVGGIMATGGLGSAAGLGTAGVTALTSGVMGFSGMGSGMGEAYEDGATDGEAVLYGAIAGASDAITEMIFGGLGKAVNAVGLSRGLSSLDDLAAKKVSSMFSNQIMKNLSQLGVKATAEGVEEVLAGIAQAAGKKATYMSEKEFSEILKDENLLEQFVVGAVTSGISQAPSFIGSTVKGRDFISGLDQNEQAVVNKEVENRIAEAEKDGKKLTKKEKGEIDEQVRRALERGYLSTDLIEETLAGDLYAKYKRDSEWESSLRKEYDELYNMKSGEKSSKQSDREAELKKYFESIEGKDSKALKGQITSKVTERIKDSRLAESYREVERGREKFTADLSKYDEEQRAVVQKAIDSGILNNTNRSHDFVDFVAKISADTNTPFEFSNNERLKASGFALADGKMPNGIKTKDGIVLNMSSNESRRFVVGHEITHVLEGTDLYTELQTAVFDYAKTKGEYETRLKAITDLYEKYDPDADPLQELTADLVGDYIFGDQDFVNNLSAKNQNVFQKIYSEIKHLLKLATAGSKEARMLENAKRAFEKAYREGGKSQSDAGVRYSVTESFTDSNGTRFDNAVLLDTDFFDGISPRNWGDKLRKWVNERASTDPFILPIIDENGNETILQFARRSDRVTKNGASEHKVLDKLSSSSDNISKLAVIHIDEVISVSEENSPYYTNENNHQWLDENGWLHRNANVINQKNGNIYNLTVDIAKTADGRTVLYATEGKIKKVGNVQVNSLKIKGSGQNSNFTDTIPHDSDTVKHSLSDADGNDVQVLPDGSVTKYSLSTWTPETQARVQGDLIRAGYDEKTVDKWIKDTNGVAAVIAADKSKLDFEAADNQVMLKDNQEYIKTLDASTLCAKRLIYQGTFDAIQHKLPNTVLTSDMLIELLNMMKDEKVQTPCGVCYVESRRRHLGKFAQQWLDGYDGEYKPNLDEVTTSDGLEALRHSHPDTYKDFVDAMNKKGSSNPKVVQLRTEYRNDIMNLTPAQIRKIEAIGGLRVQSFSDFETPHLLDMMQAVMDMSAKGLHSQAYTKVPNFAWVFGDTGIKINLSLIAEGNGFDADGNLAFSPVEGMDIDEAMKLRDAYSQNVGTIIVGANDEHILACMADDRIDFIIPFHRSGWGKKELEMMGMDSYTDYTYGQNEHDLSKPTKVVDGVQQYAGLKNLYPPDYWNYELSGKENAERYLNLCAKLGREPKFSQFLVDNGDGSYSLQPDGSTDGYWKTLIDFKMYDNDGNGAAQQKVVPNFNMEEAHRILNEYEGNANSLPVANKVVEKFVNKYRDDIAPAPVQQRSITEGDRMASDPLSALQLQDDIAPPVPGTAPAATVAENANVQAEAPMQEEDPIAPAEATTEVTTAEETPVAEDERPVKTVKERLTAQLEGRQTELENIKNLRDETIRSYDEKIAAAQASLDRKKNKETKVANALKKRIERLKRLKADIVAGYSKRISDIESGVDKISAELEKDHTERDRYEEAIARINATLESDKAALTAEYAARKAEQQALIEDKNTFVSRMAKELYDEISSLRKGVRASKNLASLLDAGYEWRSLKSAMAFLRYHPGETVENGSAADSAVRQLIEDAYEETAYGLDDLDVELAEKIQELENKAEAERRSARSSAQRKLVPERIMNYIKEEFAEEGFDLDEVLRKAKNLSTWRTVDNTPQRVMEKALGYKEGRILADITVNKVAQNETEGIRWLNSFTDPKNGLLAQISKRYNIKPGSDESAAAQMYAEGFYVNAANEIVEYGDVELAKDFPDIVKRSQIKGMARDPRIRKIYDETLDAVNESRARNGYPEIQRINNYFLHFRAMNDTFSKLGLPFNPNDIRAKDLPTDLNGATADLKPGQPYFASAQHRIGKRTSFDLLGGLEQYLTSAKNQIYHIDDIQNLRALRNYIADMYGQAVGLEDLNVLSEEEQQERIKQVYGSHLSTFAKFLNEEANILAGKTSLIDRGLEGIIGRRGLSLLNSLNGQVGANMVGYNVSSALTNFLAPIQAMAKTDPRATIAGYAQFISNKLKSINGKGDGFAEQSPVMIRRKGAERFNRTLWQRLSDPGYALMSAVDDISTELIARSKFNEFVQKGMDPQQAHIETDKWVSRLMGDRSLGQQPHLFNSKTLGILTKFQLEVRNQLDSQFYDTMREAETSYEDIEDGLMRNAKIAAKVGATFFALAVGQHLFGKAFEAVAGYNPAFDVISAIIKTFGWDDDEESEDTVQDNIEQGIFELVEDMPYVSTLTGGRVPMASALPIKELYSGEDQYGNEKSRWKTLREALPYYLLPGGYGQIKKTAAGLSMFSDEHPIAGSYTQSGNMRFPLEDNLVNRAQAAVFGQYASRNARNYFDDELAPLNEKQTQEYAESGMTIQEYRKYREGLKKYDKQADKAHYIDRLDLTNAQKEVLKSYLYDEEKYKEENPEKYAWLESEGIGYLGYKELDEDTQSAWSWAFNHQDEYQYYKANGVMPGDYTTYYIPMLDFENESDKAYQWALEYPEKASFGKVFGEGVTEYRQYVNDLSELKSDKDENGKSIAGSRKQKVLAYINSLDIDYGAKLILFKDEYNGDNESNYQILEYLNSREDITFEEKLAILREIGFTVTEDGNVYWD